MREIMRRYATERKILIFLGLVGGFTILGPFGTYEVLSFWDRLVFWTLIFTAIGFMMHVAIVLCLDAKWLAGLPRLARIAAGAAIAALPGAAVVIFLTDLYFPARMDTSNLPMIWGQITAIGIVAGWIEYPAPTPAEDRPVHTRFHDRLPKGAPHDIISLSMSDHYVEVTTTTGQHLVLLRFSDALDEIAALDGVRLHRSHWAARAHLAGVARKSGKPVATLSDGRNLPISKSYLDAVTAATQAG